MPPVIDNDSSSSMIMFAEICDDGLSGIIMIYAWRVALIMKMGRCTDRKEAGDVCTPSFGSHWSICVDNVCYENSIGFGGLLERAQIKVRGFTARQKT
jgi:hypothetical protein